MPPRPFPTHFLCIPLVTPSSRPQLAQALEAFTTDLTGPAGSGIPPGAVRPVGTLHLTLGVCSFPRGEGLERAAEVLRSLRLRDLLAAPADSSAKGVTAEASTTTTTKATEIAAANPLTVTLRGLASMQPAGRASVLYTSPVDRLGTLQDLCERIRGAFREAGLLLDDGRPLLLHATVLNTVYARREDRRGGRGGGRKERLTIDARTILDLYEDQVWAEGVEVDRVALCRMGAKKTVIDGVEDEAYEVEAEVELRE